MGLNVGQMVCPCQPSFEMSVSLVPVPSSVGSPAVPSGKGGDAMWQCDGAPAEVTDGGGVVTWARQVFWGIVV